MSSLTVSQTTLDTFRRYQRRGEPVRCPRCGLVSFSSTRHPGLTRPCPRCLPGRLEVQPPRALDPVAPGDGLALGA